MRSLVGELLPRRQPTNESPVPYVGRSRSGLASAFAGRGGTLDRERQAAAMEGNGSLFAIVGGIAQDVAAVEWHMHRRVKGKGEACPIPNCDATGVELVEAHAALDVWNDNPNPHMSRQEIVETIQQHLDLTGEGWPVFALAGKLPLEIWPVYPHRMTPVPDRKKFLAGYVYSSPDGEQVPLGVNEVGLMRQPHPLDVMRGLSAVGALSTDLGTAAAARAWNRNFFANSAEPGGIIEVERRLTDDEFDEMVERWREQHQGVSNAHRVAVLEQGRWVDRKYTMRDMQFAELLGVSDAAVRKAYRYPVSMLGESGDVNRATAESHRAQYAQNLLVPRLDRWRGMLNRKFLPQFGATAKGLEFAYASPVPADAEAANSERDSKATAAKALVEAGYDGESVKIAYSLPDALVWSKPEPPAVGGRVAAGKPVDEFSRATAHLLDLPAEPARRPRNALEIRAQVDLDGLGDDWTAALDALVGDWQPVLDAQLKDLAKQIRAAVKAGDPAAAATLEITSTRGADVIAKAMDKLAGKAEARTIAEAAAQGVQVDNRLTNEVAAWEAIALAIDALISAGLLLVAGREVLRWMGYGRSADATADAVVAQVRAGAERSLRARLGGALTWAQNKARIGVFRRAPKAKYYASEILDGNTCARCSEIDGQELPSLEAMNLAYGGGGYLFCLGLDRCRGTAIAIWQ